MLTGHVDAMVGGMLGKDYRVIEPIGMGGMAIVYLVEHQTLHKQFAAKVLSPELAQSVEARARFTQEAHAASQLDHENIVRISDFGTTADQRPFYVMELLRGHTLDERLQHGALPLEEVVAIAVPIARALAHAHAEGIVHRDIKPENVFLVRRSQGRWGVKVVDFGIAKSPSNPRLTKMGETLGSPLFMSPEQCRGDDVDQRADIYSFGILLYLMLCGRLPFDDANLLKVLQLQVSAPLPPPRSINPVLSPALEAVLVRALAKNPVDRYPTIDELLLELEAALPPDADRMLIAAASGTRLHATPFPGTLALRPEFSRASQPIPLRDPPAHSQQIPPVQIAPVLPAGTRRFWPIIALCGLVGASVAVLLWPTPTRQPSPAPVAAPAPPPPPVVLPAPAVVVDAAPVAIVEAPPPPPAPPSPARRRRVVTPAPRRVAPAPPPPVAIVEPAAPLVPAPAPALPAPAPVPEPPPPVIGHGSLDAVPSIATLDVRGPLPSSAVRRSVERTLAGLRSCYRSAARAQHATPAIDLVLGFEIDENGAAADVSTRGTFGTLAACATATANQIRTQQAPDVGTVRVSVTIRFQPT